MKKMKKSMVPFIIVLILALAACGGSAVVQGVNNPDGGAFTIEEIQDNPTYYVGTITLTGIVGSSDTQDFSLRNETGFFQVLVDYRGSQALPQLGDMIIIEGVLRENRPCCGPGFTLTATQFEAVGN